MPFMLQQTTRQWQQPGIVKVATEKKKPVFAGDPGTFDAGCVAGFRS